MTTQVQIGRSVMSQLPRAPLLSINVTEKVQPVKWNFKRRREKFSRRQLPPLHQEREQVDASPVDEEGAALADANALAEANARKARSLDIAFGLYGGRSASPHGPPLPPPRRRPVRRRSANNAIRGFAHGDGAPGAPTPISASAPPLADEEEADWAHSTGVHTVQEEGDWNTEWDEVRSVQALQSAGSGTEQLDLGDDAGEEDGYAVATLIDKILYGDNSDGDDIAADLNDSSKLNLDAVCENGSSAAEEDVPREEDMLDVNLCDAFAFLAAGVPLPTNQRQSLQHQSSKEQLVQPAAARASSKKLDADPPPTKALPQKPAEPTPTPMPVRMAAPSPVTMPTLDDLLFSPRPGMGKASTRNAGKRLPRLEGAPMKHAPHTAR